MEDFNYNELHIEYLPTEERREYARRLRGYVEYFKAQMDSVDKRTEKDRIMDILQKKKTEEQQKQLQDRMVKYGELVMKMVARSQEEYANKEKDIVDADPGKLLVNVMKPITSVAGVAAATPGVGRIGGFLVIF